MSTDRRVFNGKTPRGTPIETRFWSKVRGDDYSQCWEWTAGTVPGTGYGTFHVATGKRANAHRWAYQNMVGSIPDGLELDHLCRNRACVNPWHMEPVTARVNVRRGMSPGARALRRDKCDNGHSFNDYGVVRAARRVCRLCRALYSRAYLAKESNPITWEVMARYQQPGDEQRFLHDTRKTKGQAA